MFYVTQPENRPDGYVVLSESSQWVRWLQRNIPETVHNDIRRRLTSNLKHLIVGLELKAALIDGHQNRKAGGRPTLFEPYFQNLILEFCIAAFSVFEGLGSANWLAENGQDGYAAPLIYRNAWLPTLTSVYDEQGNHGLREAVEHTLAVRDKLHQDRLGARADIDWHALSHDRAYAPARLAVGTILMRHADFVPESSNLKFSEA